MRRTRQKRTIREVFETADRPLSPHDVVALAQKEIPSLGIATVYRTIKKQVEAGWLVQVASPGGILYEVANKGHHHHFFCRNCARTFDVDGCIAGVDRLVPAGFVAESHDLTFHGRCDACTRLAETAAAS